MWLAQMLLILLVVFLALALCSKHSFMPQATKQHEMEYRSWVSQFYFVCRVNSFLKSSFIRALARAGGVLKRKHLPLFE